MHDTKGKYLPGSSVTPYGKFLVGLHNPPPFTVANMREKDAAGVLGHSPDGRPVLSEVNFPENDVDVTSPKAIYEIANAFLFRGATFIDSGWADARAEDPGSFGLPSPGACSLRKVVEKHSSKGTFAAMLQDLPLQMLYDLAANSTDPEELAQLARYCGRIEHDKSGRPTGLGFVDRGGEDTPDIDNFELFETIANNPHLPDAYKEVMVLRPGIQGTSEIVGEYTSDTTHVFEYLRSNSYIPGGHYAANMANDAIRYTTRELSFEDFHASRHLYYQRSFLILAGQLGISVTPRRKNLDAEELEQLREQILAVPADESTRAATLWGWNFGYDLSGSGYRLHASHQMIHQQYAMVPATTRTVDSLNRVPAYSCGDLVADTVARYQEATDSDFFSDLLLCVRGNTRTDGKDGAKNLVVWEDENVLLFVPKAQVSQWEMQLMVVADTSTGPVGNVVEADSRTRKSLDRGILTAQKIYSALEARMVTSIEIPKRLGEQNGQRLVYSFLPKLPWSMGAFSEAQLRFICGHYPEDFAACCRQRLENLQPF